MFEVTPKGDIERLKARLRSPEPQACFVLNRNIADEQLFDIVQRCMVLTVRVDGEIRDLVVAGLWDPDSDVDDDVDTEGVADWSLFSGKKTDKGFLLDKSLTKAQLSHLAHIFELEWVERDGEPHVQMRVVYRCLSPPTALTGEEGKDGTDTRYVHISDSSTDGPDDSAAPRSET